MTSPRCRASWSFYWSFLQVVLNRLRRGKGGAGRGERHLLQERGGGEGHLLLEFLGHLVSDVVKPAVPLRRDLCRKLMSRTHIRYIYITHVTNSTTLRLSKQSRPYHLQKERDRTKTLPPYNSPNKAGPTSRRRSRTVRELYPTPPTSPQLHPAPHQGRYTAHDPSKECAVCATFHVHMACMYA